MQAERGEHSLLAAVYMRHLVPELELAALYVPSSLPWETMHKIFVDDVKESKEERRPQWY